MLPPSAAVRGPGGSQGRVKTAQGTCRSSDVVDVDYSGGQQG